MREENKQIDLDYRVSISPTRNRSRSKGFTVKPTSVNHFTGKRLTVEDTRTVDLEVPRDALQSGKKRTASEDDQELFVQVGEHTQVFKYGNKDDQKPELIDEYISYFRNNKSNA